jgi:hypothetical protein
MLAKPSTLLPSRRTWRPAAIRLRSSAAAVGAVAVIVVAAIIVLAMAAIIVVAAEFVVLIIRGTFWAARWYSTLRLLVGRGPQGEWEAGDGGQDRTQSEADHMVARDQSRPQPCAEAGDAALKKCLIITMTAWFAIGSCSGLVQAEPRTPAFYETASKIQPQGELGRIVSQEQVQTSVAGAQAWRIAYVSSDMQGRPVVAPAGQPPTIGRPIMAWAHGTTGTAQNCGPSQLLNPAQELNEYFLMNGDSWTDYGLPTVDAFIRQGYVVVASDYQGLGGGGRHQYAVAATQARDVINSIRAASDVKPSGAGKKEIV